MFRRQQAIIELPRRPEDDQLIRQFLAIGFKHGEFDEIQHWFSGYVVAEPDWTNQNFIVVFKVFTWVTPLVVHVRIQYAQGNI